MPVSVATQLEQAGMSAAAAAAKQRMFERLKLAAGGGRLEGARAYWVPGRVELLGKHTDYAGGRSLLSALERGFCVLAAPRPDVAVRFVDVAGGREAIWAAMAGAAGEGWAGYPAAVLRRLAADGRAPARGVEVYFASDLPQAAGLSSSSALVVASYLAVVGGLSGAEREERERLAAYLAAAEVGVGTHGGSEDHTAMLCCAAGRWSQYRFCPIRHEADVAAPAELALVIALSGVRAEKGGAAQSRYNRAAGVAAALAECRSPVTGGAPSTLGAALASAPGVLEKLRLALQRGPVPAGFDRLELAARLEQFYQESEVLIPAALAAARGGDWTAFGAAVAASQAAAERALGNQIPETVALVREARALAAVAASAFGAGFGGAVWALVERERAEPFGRRWLARYQEAFAERAGESLCFVSAAGPAALELDSGGL
ncbi:MAG: galactokinase family protein [Terriglobales bacterium]